MENQRDQIVSLNEKKEGFISTEKDNIENQGQSITTFYDIDYEDEFDVIRSTN